MPKYAGLTPFTEIAFRNTTPEERLIAAKCTLLNALPVDSVPVISTLEQIESEDILSEYWPCIVRSSIELIGE